MTNQSNADKLVTEVTDILNNNLDPTCGECDDCIITWSDSAAIPLVVNLIRNEKLKLLAEVRNHAEGLYSRPGSNAIIIEAVPLTDLYKLEAEL